MRILDWVRVLLGNLTPEEVIERDERAAARREAKRQAVAVKVAEEETWACYQRRLRRAAGVSSLTVVCPEEAWRFVERYARLQLDWRSPDPDRERPLADHTVAIQLSGIQIVTVLYVLARACRVDRRAGADIVPGTDRSIAQRLYEEFGAAVDSVDAAAAAQPVPAGLAND